MVSVTIQSVDVKGYDSLVKTLRHLSFTLNPEQVVKATGVLLLKRVQQRFLRQVDPDNRPWPISAAAKKRAAEGRQGGTLFDTGRLYRSLKLVKPRNQERTISTDVPYATYHQNGIGQVQRRFLGFNEEDANAARLFMITKIREAVS